MLVLMTMKCVKGDSELQCRLKSSFRSMIPPIKYVDKTCMFVISIPSRILIGFRLQLKE